MSFSIQTNVSSMVAQENLRVNNEFQSRTIQRLTSGYRINASGDDAAGLAVANKFRSDIAELTQGVRNANDGLSQLQIIDGGLNNISKMLDRMKTLATQSGSGTFSGSRDTLNNEYKSLLSEIDRQASNIYLDAGGKYNANISVYIGVGSTTANAQVSVDLSGTGNVVTSHGLALDTTSVAGSGTAVGDAASSATATQDFVLTFGDGTSQTITTVGGTQQQVLDDLNQQLASYGVTAAVAKDSGGTDQLVFGSAKAFSVYSAATAGGIVAAGANTVVNTGMYNTVQQADWADLAGAGATETLSFQTAQGTKSVSFASGDDIDTAIAKINSSQVGTLGIQAVKVQTGAGNYRIAFMSDSFFTVSESNSSLTADTGFNGASALGSVNAADTSASLTGNAQLAIDAIGKAVAQLGKVQGTVGAGQNKLQYAIQLAQSQVGNFSAAESRIRDADVAAEAANLTKAQVLQQASLAAMAQANSAPQAVLALLRG